MIHADVICLNHGIQRADLHAVLRAVGERDRNCHGGFVQTILALVLSSRNFILTCQICKRIPELICHRSVDLIAFFFRILLLVFCSGLL